MPKAKKQPVSLEESIESVREIASKSFGLWRPVNETILRELREGLEAGRTPREIADRLMKYAGRKRPNEPIAVENYRAAARALRASEKVWVL